MSYSLEKLFQLQNLSLVSKDLTAAGTVGVDVQGASLAGINAVRDISNTLPSAIIGSNDFKSGMWGTTLGGDVLTAGTSGAVMYGGGSNGTNDTMHGAKNAADVFILDNTGAVVIGDTVRGTGYEAGKDQLVFYANDFSDVKVTAGADVTLTVNGGTQGNVTLNGAGGKVITMLDQNNNTGKILTTDGTNKIKYTSGVNAYYGATTTAATETLELSGINTNLTLWLNNDEALPGAPSMYNVNRVFASNINSKGNLTIYGNANDNAISLGDGNDVLWGGKGGSNTLTGGSGGDNFLIDNLSKTQVTDYKSNQNDVVSFYNNYFADLSLSIAGGTGTNVELKFKTDADKNATLTGATDKVIVMKDRDGNAGKVLISGEEVLDFAQDINAYYGGTVAGGVGTSSKDIVKVGATAGAATIWLNSEEALPGGASFYGVNNIDAANSKANNTFYGNSNTNTIVGGYGNDVLWGGKGGLNTLTGGKGNDTFLVDGYSKTTITDYADSEKDVLSFYRNEFKDVKVSLASTTGLSSDRDVVFKATVDDVTENTSQFVTVKGAADRTMILKDRNGNEGRVLISSEKDLAYGQDINAYYAGKKDKVVVDSTSGTANIWLNSSEAVAGAASFYGVNNIDASKSAANNTLYGNDSNNVIIGGSGNDLLWGGKAGANELTGGAGNDTFYITSNTNYNQTAINDANSLDKIMFLNIDLTTATCQLNSNDMVIDVDSNNKLTLHTWSAAKDATFVSSTDNGATTTSYKFDSATSKFVKA